MLRYVLCPEESKSGPTCILCISGQNQISPGAFGDQMKSKFEMTMTIHFLAVPPIPGDEEHEEGAYLIALGKIKNLH